MDLLIWTEVLTVSAPGMVPLLLSIHNPVLHLGVARLLGAPRVNIETTTDYVPSQVTFSAVKHPCRITSRYTKV